MKKTESKKNKPIVLIGMMGAGKTTIGELLARHLELSWIDTDHHVESTTKQEIPEIFEHHGERYFRELESQALIHALAHFDVISSGGGVITIDKNSELLKDAYVIYLKAEIKTLVDRLNATDRPLLKDVDMYQRLTDLLEMRRGLYESAADLIVETDKLSPDQVVAKIEEVLEKIYRFGCQHFS